MIHRIFSASLCNLMFLQTRCEIMIFCANHCKQNVDSNYQRNPAIITLFLYEYYFSSTNTTFPLRILLLLYEIFFLKISQNFSKFLKISQNLSKSLKISQNLSKFPKIVLKISQFFQNLSKKYEKSSHQ